MVVISNNILQKRIQEENKMPIEVNRIDRYCPKCKNPTIFNTGKQYFCGKCLSTIEKKSDEEFVVISTMERESIQVDSKENEITNQELKIGEFFENIDGTNTEA